MLVVQKCFTATLKPQNIPMRVLIGTSDEGKAENSLSSSLEQFVLFHTRAILVLSQV